MRPLPLCQSRLSLRRLFSCVRFLLSVSCVAKSYDEREYTCACGEQADQVADQVFRRSAVLLRSHLLQFQQQTFGPYHWHLFL